MEDATAGTATLFCIRFGGGWEKTAKAANEALKKITKTHTPCCPLIA